MVKNAGHVRDVGLTPGLGRSPGEGNAEGNGVKKLTPVSLPGKPHEQGNLAGYNSQGSKESDTTEHTYTHTPTKGFKFQLYSHCPICAF